MVSHKHGYEIFVLFFHNCPGLVGRKWTCIPMAPDDRPATLSAIRGTAFLGPPRRWRGPL